MLQKYSDFSNNQVFEYEFLIWVFVYKGNACDFFANGTPFSALDFF